MLLSYCTGKDSPQGHREDLKPQLAHLDQSPRNFILVLHPSYMSVCVCRFPVPPCADPATHPLCISWNNSQTHQHPEEWVQYWQLLHTLATTKAREPSMVSPVTTTQTRISTRALGAPNASLAPKMPQPKQGFCSSPGCSLSLRMTVTVLYIVVGSAHSSQCVRSQRSETWNKRPCL